MQLADLADWLVDAWPHREEAQPGQPQALELASPPAAPPEATAEAAAAAAAEALEVQQPLCQHCFRDSEFWENCRCDMEAAPHDGGASLIGMPICGEDEPLPPTVIRPPACDPWWETTADTPHTRHPGVAGAPGRGGDPPPAARRPQQQPSRQELQWQPHSHFTMHL